MWEANSERIAASSSMGDTRATTDTTPSCTLVNHHPGNEFGRRSGDGVAQLPSRLVCAMPCHARQHPHDYLVVGASWRDGGLLGTTS